MKGFCKAKEKRLGYGINIKQQKIVCVLNSLVKTMAISNS